MNYKMIEKNYALKTSKEAIITFSENEYLKGRNQYNKEIISKLVRENTNVAIFLEQFKDYSGLGPQSGLMVYELWDLETKLRIDKLDIPRVSEENVVKTCNNFRDDIIIAEKVYENLEEGIKHIAKDELVKIREYDPLLGNYLSAFSINKSLSSQGHETQKVPIYKIEEMLNYSYLEQPTSNSKKISQFSFEIKKEHQRERLASLLMEEIDSLLPGIVVYRILEKQTELNSFRYN